MELLTLRQLAKESGRAFATLQRYALTDKIPTVGMTEDTAPLKDAIYPRDEALAYVATLRKNKNRKIEEQKELTETEKHIERVKDKAVGVAGQAALRFMKDELALAETEGSLEVEIALHREIADMLENQAAQVTE